MNRFGVINLLVAIGLAASVTAAAGCGKPPEPSEIKECCPHDNLISKEILDKCKSLLEDGAEPPSGVGGPRGGPRGGPGPGHKGGHGHGPPKCYFECAVNETGILNGQNIDEANAKTYLSTVLSANPTMIPVVQSALVTCAKMINEMPSRPEMGDDTCKMFSAKLMHCTEVETLVNCPSSEWKNDDACNNAKDFFKNCKPPHPPSKE